VDASLNRAFVVHGGTFQPEKLAAFDLSNGRTVFDVDAPGWPTVDTVNHRILLVSVRTQTVTVVNAVSGALEAPITISRPPSGLAVVDPGRGCLYLPHDEGLLTVVDTVHRRELGQVPVGSNGAGHRSLDVDRATGRLYVANPDDDTISVIEGGRCDLIDTPTPESSPTSTPAPTNSPPPGTPTAPPTPSPVATATLVPSPTASPGASPSPTRTAAPTAPAVRMCICRNVRDRVPVVVINDAVANPERYYGWMYPLDPGKPPGPANPPRTCLSLANTGLDYNPLSNKPQWRVGCP
jgi:DNA-binding beta-propeller fold protein YncE